MDDCQRRQIEAMRKQGMGYKAIARETKLSRDSVRNYCRWHHLNGYGAAVAAAFRKETVYEDHLIWNGKSCLSASSNLRRIIPGNS
jgi:hypothetical protein